MPSKWFGIVIDSADPAELSKFWAQALGYQVMFSSPEEVALAKDEHSFPGLIFVPVPEVKQLKNRLHIDLNPDDQKAEVERLIGLGARRVDIGQGEVRWVVLADPEGNEFCVLSPHPEQE
jgi:predicted enzyme related to lactoylglutathione lyase